MRSHCALHHTYETDTGKNHEDFLHRWKERHTNVSFSINKYQYMKNIAVGKNIIPLGILVTSCSSV